VVWCIIQHRERFVYVITAPQALCLHYKAEPVNAVREVITICCGNNTRHINAFCIQNGESCNVKADTMVSYHLA